MIHKSTAKWAMRLQLCIDHESGHLERILAHSSCILVLISCSTTCSQVIDIQSTESTYSQTV